MLDVLKNEATKIQVFCEPTGKVLVTIKFFEKKKIEIPLLHFE